MRVHLMLQGYRLHHVRPAVVGARAEQVVDSQLRERARTTALLLALVRAATASGATGTAVVVRTTDETAERELELAITC
ncbi:MAG: hypothetical protein ACLFS9_02190 [Nitriliruptoraceae bacterium]